jgi:hypothetical protein
MADSTADCLSVDVAVAGSNYYVRILSTIDRELLKPSASVALHKHSNALVDVLPPEADSSISMLQAGVSHHGVLQYFCFICMRSGLCPLETGNLHYRNI